MGSKAPSWSDQWGSGNYGVGENEHEKAMEKKKSGKKMDDVKAAASVGLAKAKVAAIFGAQKVKTGTSFGVKWIKNQYQKRTSK